MISVQKKWASFEEMYDDLKNGGQFKDSLKTNAISAILKLIKEIETVKTSKDFFDCTCKLSSFFETLDTDTTHEVYNKTNVYVSVLNATFRNDEFARILLDLLSRDKNIADLKKDEKDLEKLIFLNSALSLAFFGIALDYKIINKNSIEFLRNNTTDLFKKILKQQKVLNNNFVNLCYFLEKIAWDKGLHYNENYNSKFAVKLDSNFLFTNLKTSRAFAGITCTSLVIRPAIENRFKKVISSFSDEKFSISFALDSIYQTCNELDEKIKHYYRNTPENISVFFDVFIRSNERNLIFCFKNFCQGLHYQGKQKRFYEIVSEKLNNSAALKEEFASYLKENFKAFNDKIEDGDDEWTNKLFLISIKTLAVLGEIKNAHDSRWITNVAVHEFRQWIVEIHEVLNKYYIEDDWEKIRHLVLQENENIEWKSSFYTPLEQVFTDNESEAVIQKRIFEKIIKVILAMLNTDGGTLIVGIVENPDVVKRLDAKEFFVEKNNITFFDISYEFKKQNKTLDHVRLQILDNLKCLTDNSVDEFNNLIEFEPIILRNSEQVASIVKISIKKSKTPFFNVLKENNSVWISLTKRAQGRNVDVDIRKHI